MTIEFERGSGNVYADLCLPDAAEMLVKAKLTARIQQAIDAAGLTQSAAAKRMGITQPKLSNILRGNFRGVSEDRLMRCLAALGHDVTIIVSARGPVAGTVDVAFLVKQVAAAGLPLTTLVPPAVIAVLTRQSA